MIKKMVALTLVLLMLGASLVACKKKDDVPDGMQSATVEGERLALDVYTDQEGVQFYIGNFLGSGPDFKGGVKQVQHGAFCLETQTEPNCIKSGKAIYDAGELYTHICVYEIRKI